MVSKWFYIVFSCWLFSLAQSSNDLTFIFHGLVSPVEQSHRKGTMTWTCTLDIATRLSFLFPTLLCLNVIDMFQGNLPQFHSCPLLFFIIQCTIEKVKVVLTNYSCIACLEICFIGFIFLYKMYIFIYYCI